MTQPKLTVVPPMHMSLYPTMDSVAEAISFIESQIPLNTPNEVFSLLMLFHNTLLKVWHESQETSFTGRPPMGKN